MKISLKAVRSAVASSEVNEHCRNNQPKKTFDRKKDQTVNTKLFDQPLNRHGAPFIQSLYYFIRFRSRFGPIHQIKKSPREVSPAGLLLVSLKFSQLHSWVNDPLLLVKTDLIFLTHGFQLLNHGFHFGVFA